jgi:hypothetical protein
LLALGTVVSLVIGKYLFAFVPVVSFFVILRFYLFKDIPAEEIDEDDYEIETHLAEVTNYENRDDQNIKMTIIYVAEKLKNERLLTIIC